MKGIIVLSMEFDSPQAVVDAITHLDPPNVPSFAGELRVAVDEVAVHVEKWLDE